MSYFSIALLLLIPPIAAVFEELPTWPCPFNPLCHCSSAGPNPGMVVCENVPLTDIPLHLNEFKIFSISLRSNGIVSLEENRLTGTGIWRAEISNNFITELHNDSLAGLEHSLHQLVLKNNRLLAIPTGALQNLLKLQQLDLSGNLMIDIHHNDFQDFGKSLVSLDLSNNLLSYISNDAFHSLDNLETLDLTNSGIASLPELLFQHGPTRLRHLYVAENMQRNIPFATINYLKHLQTLDLAHNLIASISDVSFQDKLSVDTLLLDSNLIEKLPSLAFQNFRSINFTSLQDNNIDAIEEDAFKDVTIRAINLKSCGISYILEHAFRGLEEVLQNIDLSQNNITEIPDFKNFESLKNISFQGNPISEISAETFELYPHTVQYLNLMGKEIDQVETPASPLLRNLRCVSLARIEDTAISADFFRNFSPAMEEFTLNHGSITKIKKAAFQYIPGLQKLDLSNNRILSIGDGAFDDIGHSLQSLFFKNGLQLSRYPVEAFELLIHLEMLDLSNNHISDLPFDSFYSMHHLKYLKLQDNDIQVLEPRIFISTNNPHLKEVHLSFNKLRSLQSALFLGFDKLQALYLDDNQIETVEQHTFIHLSVLEKLMLNGNAIVDIDAEAFRNLPRLRFLSLAYNQLTQFSLDSFDQVGSLTSLDIDISHNLLQNLSVNSTTYPSYSYIHRIDFSHNNISNIDQHYFDPIRTTLTHLNMNYNSLDEVTDTMFSGLSQLHLLELCHNNISFLHHRALASSRKLQILHLDNNVISELPNALFENLTSLRALYLHKNKLQKLPEDIFKKTELEILDIAHNQLAHFANVSLAPISDHLRSLNISNNYLRFLDPDEMKTFSQLQILDLSHNLLTEIQKDTFDSLRMLVQLDISHNWFQTLSDHTLFGPSQTLRYLSIANTSLTTLPLLPLHRLVELNVSLNELSTITPGALANVSELRVLDVSNNLLSAVPSSSWHMIPDLYKLHLSQNPIQSLTNSSFVGLSHLRKLRLIEIPLNVFQAGALKAMPALESLHLNLYTGMKGFNFTNVVADNSNLAELLINVLHHMLSSELHGKLPPHLRSVIITGYNLTTIAPNAFQCIQKPSLHIGIHSTSIQSIPSLLLDQQGMEKTLSLDVRGNQLKSLATPAMYTSINYLRLQDNPWNCNCNIGWIEGWLRTQRQNGHSATECAALTQEIREAVCSNYGNRSMLEVFKTELECGWSPTGQASHSHTHTFSLYSNLILIIFALKIMY